MPRDLTLIRTRNQQINERFNELTALFGAKKHQYTEIIELLSKEFYLSEKTIYKILKQKL